MSTIEAALLAVVAVVIVLAAVYVAVRLRRRHELRRRFGDEYEVVLDEHGSKRRTDRELIARQARHDELDIRSLDPQVRLRFAEQWRDVQSRFVDEPEAALADAGRLLDDVMVERGYPVGDADRQLADLSVEHSDVLRHYRQAQDATEEATAGRSTTESLRRGMLHYRALFDALLEHHAETPTSRR